MKAKQVLFLLKMELINSKLIKNWQEKNKPFNAWTEVRSAISWQRLAFFTFAVAILTLLSGFFSGGWPIKVVGTIMIGCIGLYVLVTHGESKFAEDITTLNNLLRLYPKDNRFESYCLNLDTMWMVCKARWLLIFFASELRNHETSLGVDNPTTQCMRVRFKNAHATLVNFGLCNPNQGVYLRCAEESKVPEAEPVTAPPTQ